MLPWLQDSEHSKKIAVIGDLILDEYLTGEINRISPEAPVPVHRVVETRYSAGGSANAARNISLCGGQVFLFGVLGDDESARSLRHILTGDGINTDGIYADPQRPTIKKTRIMAGNQQVVRVDWEKNQAISSQLQNRLLMKLKQTRFDAILISDYGKGGLPKQLMGEIMAHARRTSTPVVVDPKGKDFSRYEGCDVITPNTSEALDALDLDENRWTGEDLARQLQERFGLAGVLVTMGSHGMVYVAKNAPSGCTIRKKSRAREVFDVSGAGDTVAALITLGLSAGCSMDEAMQVASIGAGLVVEKLGTQPISKGELIDALSDRGRTSHSTTGKIIDAERLAQILDNERSSGKKIVFTNGCFDILHAGHLSYLEQARSLGDILVVGVNSDLSISRIKGISRPIVDEQNRLRMLAGLACIDYVTWFSEDTPLELITRMKPHVLVKGADYQDQVIVGAKEVERLDGEVRCLPLVEGLSTSKIVEKIRSTP